MVADPQKSEGWNRGAYLVEGLGHCSACHSPRDLFYAEKGGDQHLAGNYLENWHMHSLRRIENIPLPWTQEDLVQYMQTGFSPNHGVAAGPMVAVVGHGLSRQSLEDQQAIATYLLSYHYVKKEEGPSAATINAEFEQSLYASRSEGARLLTGACMACHAQTKGTPMVGVRPSLVLNTNLYIDTPDNMIHVVLDGISTPATPELGYMPGFGNTLNDRQIATLLNYLRQDGAKLAPWPDLEKRVGEVRALKAVH